MKTINVRDLYRELNQNNSIPKIEGQGNYTADEMIWFGEQVSSRLERIVSLQKAEIEIREEFLQTLQDIYNSKDMVEMQTKIELHFENIDSLLINKYQHESDISLLSK